MRAADVKGQEHVAPEGVILRAITRRVRLAWPLRRGAAEASIPGVRRAACLCPVNGRSSRRDAALIYTAGFVRSVTVGLVGVVLAIYLSEIGWSTAAIGVVIGAGLGRDGGRHAHRQPLWRHVRP